MILPTKNCFHGDFPCLMTLEAHLVVWLWFPPPTSVKAPWLQMTSEGHKISIKSDGSGTKVRINSMAAHWISPVMAQSSQPPFSRQPASQPATVGWWFWSWFSVGKCSYWLYQPPATDPARKKNKPLFSPRAQTAATDRPSHLIAAKWEGSTKKTEIKIQWQSLVLSMSCICHLFVSFDKSCNYLFRFKRSTCRTQKLRCDMAMSHIFFGWQKNVGPSALSKSQPPDVKHEQVSFHLGSSISQVKMARGPAFVTSTGSAGNQQLVILTIWKYHRSVPVKRPEFCKKRADFI